MKISYNWLKTLIETDLPPQEAAALLTAAGLEVEGIEEFEIVKGGLKGLVVGEVIACEKHPDADRLRTTKVNVGAGEPLSIVCGAPNVANGQKVIVATVGAKLFPSTGEPFEIKKSKIRGQVSEGMICAEDEIGLGNSHAGIMVLPDDVKVGTPASEYFKLDNDVVFEIGLTPNRSDAASHFGVARDLAAILTNVKHQPSAVKLPIVPELPEGSGLNPVTVKIENPQGCARYSGMVITGIQVKESPDWIRNRLTVLGLRPINNIVDITNFVLHELGQPLHAFDFDRIKGNKIVVRSAHANEKFTTLDGVERTLHENDLVIADEKDTMCIAGVFGGAVSGVTEKTKTIFLESAYFDPATIRKTAKQHGLKTDASFRFERGTDPEMTMIALQRAANLILEIAGGSVSMSPVDLYPEKIEGYKIAFSYLNCNELIGKEIDHHTIKNILTSLGIEIESEGNDTLLLRVPKYKTDVTREADVIEEVMRIYGYNNIPVSKSISYTAANTPKNFDQLFEQRAGALLEGWGFTEIMSLSLTKESYYGDNAGVTVLNPLSNDLNRMRSEMLYSGLETIAYNINRKSSQLRFFEVGRTYHKNSEGENPYSEKKHLTLFVTGDIYPENPYNMKKEADLSFLKSCVSNLFDKCGVTGFSVTETRYENFDYGLTFTIKKQVLAEIGAVSSKKLKSFDIAQQVFYADINWQTIVAAFSRQQISFNEIPKYPSVRRDLALLLDPSVKFEQVEALAFQTEKKLLQEVNLFDIYEGEKLGGKKSYAVSFTLIDKESTLTDKQIEAVMDKLIRNYREKLGAELR